MGLFKKNEGAITVYLSIILSIMLVLTGVLVDGARARVAEGQVQSAVEAAANSVLANYNNILKEWFGLMSMAESNPAILEEELMYYLNRNLMTELGAEKENLSGQSWDYIKKFMNTENKYEHVSFLDMYDYKVEDVISAPLYNLTENEVLRSQIVDYMKYRAPEVLGEEFLEKINVIKSYKRQSEILSSKLAVDKSMNKISEKIQELSESIIELNKFDIEVLKEKLKNVCDSIAIKVGKGKIYLELKEKRVEKEEELREHRGSDSYKETKQTLKKAYDEATDKSEKERIQKEIDSLDEPYKGDFEKAKAKEDEAKAENTYWKKEVEKLLEELYSYIIGFYLHNNIAKEKAVDVKDKASNLKIEIYDMKKQIEGDNSDFAEMMRQEVSRIEKQISEDTMNSLIKKFEGNMKVLGTVDIENSLVKVLFDMELNYIDAEFFSTFATEDYLLIYEHIYKGIMAIDTLIANYAEKYSKVSNEEFPVEAQTGSKEEVDDPRKASKKLADSSDNPLKELEKKNKHDDFEEIKKGLPSGGAKINSEDILEAFLGEDLDFAMKAIGTEVSKKDIEENPRDIVKKMDFEKDNDSVDKGFQLISKLISFLEEGLENLRDEIYVNEYALGIFNNYLSTKNLEVTEGNKMSQIDLRGRNRSERKPYMYFENEIEYILNGDADENTNVLTVMSKILIMRLALNTIHIYTEPVKRNQAYTAASSLSSMGGPLVAFLSYHFVAGLIILSWSMAESILDIKCLMSGKSVAIFKTRETWVLSVEGGLNKLKEKITGTLAEGVQSYAKKAVNYGIDNAEDVAQAAIQNVYDTINIKIENVLGKIFEPFDDALTSAEKTIKDNYTQITTSMENESADIANEDMDTVIKEIYKIALEEYKRLKGEIESKLTMPIDKAKAEIENIKKSIMNTINERLSPLKDTIKGKIAYAASAGKESINQYIDSFNTKSGGSGGGYNNIKASVLSLNYEEYLRLLLLMTNNDIKITRIQDLIQLQMVKMTGNENFKLSECNTHIGVKVSVSIKYFFMTQSFVRRELKTEELNRHKLYILLFKGY